MRPSGRRRDEMRQVQLTPHFTLHAEGSVLSAFGDTRVLCTASIEARCRIFEGQGPGLGHREYGICPPTHTGPRAKLRAAAKRPHARDTAAHRPESARGRRSRCAREHTITVTARSASRRRTRTAAITGGYVALAMAAAPSSRAARSHAIRFTGR